MTTNPSIVVLRAINAVQADIATTGIAKDRVNQQQSYKFRGIDDMYNALAPLLAKHRLVILPAYDDISVVEVVSSGGKAARHASLRGVFAFYGEDGNHLTVSTYGEAMDFGDKAVNKAMSAAFKYALMQTFTIPTEGDNDADAQTIVTKSTAVMPRPKAADVDTETGEVTSKGAGHEVPATSGEIAFLRKRLAAAKQDWETIRAELKVGNDLDNLTKAEFTEVRGYLSGF